MKCTPLSLKMNWKTRRLKSILVLVTPCLKQFWNRISPDELSLNCHISLCRIDILNIVFVSSAHICAWILENDWNDWRSCSNFYIRSKKVARLSCTVMAGIEMRRVRNFTAFLNYYPLRFDWYWCFQSTWDMFDYLLSLISFFLRLYSKCLLHQFQSAIHAVSM